MKDSNTSIDCIKKKDKRATYIKSIVAIYSGLIGIA